ncbi:hypothetical protein K0U00_33265, partial [Paenibacillus sepulcri]|nr:hypothetical protein [Paenibacillus sepulcri]
TECCSDVKAARVVFKPEGSLLFTAPRDAWKIYKCSGDFTITDMHVEGVRMDGQNMHSTFLVLKRVIGRRTAVFHAKWNYAPLKRHTGFEFWIGTDTARRTVDTWRHDGYRNGVNVYTVSFTDDLPDNVSVGTNAVPQCWSLSSYSLDGGQFRNVAGCGHVVRYDNVRISSVTYANLMNQAIFIGCEYPGFHEAGHPKNVHIRGCSFDNCGYTPRMGAVGAIGINADGFDGPYMDGIVIEDCLFRHLDTGTDISDAKRVTLRRNRYEDVRTRYRLDDNTTSDLVFEDD